MSALHDAFVYLVAAVVAVPIASRLGLGSVLGYLLAGIVIGPVCSFVGDESEDVLHFAEFGVVMMLFLVGLELKPSMLWQMRSRLLGLGGLQVLASMGIIAGVAMAVGEPFKASLAIGMILALSSTAIVLQTFEEKDWLRSPPGRSAFSVLLFQDIAVIPMFALLPLLAVATGGHADDGHHGHSGLEGLPGWLYGLVVFGVMLAIVIAGRTVMRPTFRFIASARLGEIFTAAALLLVVGIALLMEWIGLSPALGTFLAGVVLSGSEYRHELESDIAPFKGLLLGLFFISVGAGIDFGLLVENPAVIVGGAFAILAIKMTVLFPLGRKFGLRGPANWLFTLGLCQAGEFAFVLFGFAQGAGVLTADRTQPLILMVAITMLLTPLLFIVYERLIVPRAKPEESGPADTIDRKGTAIVAGGGHFGQTISRMLLTNGYEVVVLDHDPKLIDLWRKIGLEAYYGDATRPDLLHAAGIEGACLFVAALNDREKQTHLVEYVARNHPKKTILARAVDRHHIYELEEAGAQIVESQLGESSIRAGTRALVALGMHPFKAERKARAFRTHEQQMVEALRERFLEGGVDQKYIDVARARAQELFEVMKSDRAGERHDSTARGWVPPPKTGRLFDDE